MLSRAEQIGPLCQSAILQGGRQTKEKINTAVDKSLQIRLIVLCSKNKWASRFIANHQEHSHNSSSSYFTFMNEFMNHRVCYTVTFHVIAISFCLGEARKYCRAQDEIPSMFSSRFLSKHLGFNISNQGHMRVPEFITSTQNQFTSLKIEALLREWDTE